MSHFFPNKRNLDKGYLVIIGQLDKKVPKKLYENFI